MEKNVLTLKIFFKSVFYFVKMSESDELLEEVAKVNKSICKILINTDFNEIQSNVLIWKLHRILLPTEKKLTEWINKKNLKSFKKASKKNIIKQLKQKLKKLNSEGYYSDELIVKAVNESYKNDDIKMKSIVNILKKLKKPKSFVNFLKKNKINKKIKINNNKSKNNKKIKINNNKSNNNKKESNNDDINLKIESNNDVLNFKINNIKQENNFITYYESSVDFSDLD